MHCPSLTRLRQLFLEALTLKVTAIDNHRSEGDRHIASFTKLEALEVYDVRCEDSKERRLPEVIPAILDMLPVSSVHLLRFDGLGDVEENTHTDFHVVIPSRTIEIRHLSVVALDGAATAAYLVFYEKLIRVGSLECLSIFCQTWGDAEQLAVFLLVQGSSITTVDLDITSLMEQEQRNGESVQ